MKIYLASLFNSTFGIHGNIYRQLLPVEKESRDNLAHILDSYHYVAKQIYVDVIRRDGIQIFLDSGAFSAFTKGAPLDIGAYCDYIHRNQDIIEMASVMDGIGDPELTLKNQELMEQKGTKPLPCFHYGEPEEYLVHYMKNYPYITLGGMVPIAKPQLVMWLDRIWEEYLTDSDGLPKVKVHGFGLTSRRLMERYPWYSVDSSSWVQVSANGGAFTKNHRVVGFSTSSPSRKNFGQHFTTLTPLEQEEVRYDIESRGYSVELMMTRWQHRWCFCIQKFNEMNDKYENATMYFKREQFGLFT